MQTTIALRLLLCKVKTSQQVHGDNSHGYCVSKSIDLTKAKGTNVQRNRLGNMIDRYPQVFVGPDKRLGECDLRPYKMRIDPRH